MKQRQLTQQEGKLIVIDDDESYCSVIYRSMSRRGFFVKVAHTPEMGLLLCEELQPDYILLDLNLQGKSGLNLIQPLRTLSQHSKIIIFTGYASIQTTVSAIHLGAFNYLPKPATTSDIINAMQGQPDTVAVEETELSEQMSVKHLEWEYIQRTLSEHNGNISATARALKMHRRTLQRKLAKRCPSTENEPLE